MDGTKNPNGYIPHSGMSYFVCPRCGNGEFRCPPQSVPTEYTTWTFEHICCRCGHMIGLTIKKCED